MEKEFGRDKVRMKEVVASRYQLVKVGVGQ